VNRLGGAGPWFTDPPGERDFAAAGELDLEKVCQGHPAGHFEVTGLLQGLYLFLATALAATPVTEC